jgi:hypothetical protein
MGYRRVWYQTVFTGTLSSIIVVVVAATVTGYPLYWFTLYDTQY